MKKYSKLWAAIAGLVLLFAMRQADISVPGVNEMVAEIILSLFTAWGVWGVRNKDSDDSYPEDDHRGV